VSVPARRARFALAVLAVALLASACAGAGSSGTPTAASPPAAPSASPSSSPAPPDVVDDTLVARILTYPDVTAGRVPPMLSVYADGRVISPTWTADGSFAFPLIVRRLTPAGLAELRAALEASGFFAEDVEIPPVRLADSGFTAYVVTLRRGDRLVTARTTNVGMSERGAALVDLAERWTRPERELPAGAWLPDEERYVGDSWYLWLRLTPGVAPESAADSAPLEALIGDLATFGAGRIAEIGSVERCAAVPAATVARLAAALEAGGMDLGPPDRNQVLVDLGWSSGRGMVALGAFEMLPDDPPACPSQLWP
jgi:hypothetical protein